MNQSRPIDYSNIPPPNGWDAAIDLAQADKLLAQMPEKDGVVEDDVWQPAIEYLLGYKHASWQQIAFIATTFRDFGLREYTTYKKIALTLRKYLEGNDFAIKQLRRAVKFAYEEAKLTPAGTRSQAGREAPDGKGFEVGENGKPKMTARNIEVALIRMGVTFRYDKFRDRYLIEGLKGFGPYMDDAAINSIRFTFESSFKFRPPKELMFDACYNIARKNTFDPINDFFDKVQDEWDAKTRIDRFLINYAGAEDTPYVRAISRLMFVAVVRRNRHPGSKFDEMIVLESGQGLDKSSALATIAINEEWFSDSFPMDADNRETLEHAQGKIIIEVAELQGMKKADVEHVKAMLSRTTDRGRLAYARNPIEQPRRFIFVGTSNGRAYLQDQTGNRRFWPVAVKAFDLKAIKRDLRQLWGEAAVAEALGDPIRLHKSLWAAAGEQQEARLAAVDDPFTHAFRDHLSDRAGRITSEDAWLILGVDAGRRTPELQRRFGAALRAIGWKRCTMKTEGRAVGGYGHGTDTRRIMVIRHKGDPPYLTYDDEDQGGDSGTNPSGKRTVSGQGKRQETRMT